MLPSAEASPEEESAELSRFREEWKQEVRQRREEQYAEQQGTSAGERDSPHKSSSPDAGVGSSASRTASRPPPETEAKLPSTSVPNASRTLHASHGQSPLSGNIARAVEVYRCAVQHEQEGNLDRAVRLYRQAFRLNADVDHAYFKEEQRLQQSGHSTVGVGHKKTSSTSSEGGTTKGKHDHDTKAGEARELYTQGALSKILENFPEALSFEPEDVRQNVPINIVPEELLLYILRNLDTTTLECFATVSRKARVLSLDSAIWREFVHLAYKPPQIPKAVTVQMIVDGHGSSYRQTFIEHPRLRLDGAYIAVCHYVRAGLSDSAWVNVSHLITYHRYLRFFPDGTVLSLLANEEHQPSLVIPMLKPSLRMKGFSIGDWRLDGSSVLITNLVEMHPPPAQATHGHHDVPRPTRYHFQMTLTLRSKPLGRWNKLDLISYASVNIEDGEVAPLPLKHERPFWFSRVKSWQGY